ncbi:MAG: integration host factor subunit alpha [Proteobacteria bacterium]|nr:integration host factor subunit alpha [Pseudomonadota bacterium]
MTKADIIQHLIETSDLSRAKAAEVVETMIAEIKQTLTTGEDVKLSGFGNFIVREKKERLGRNPQNGEPITISARRVVNFKSSTVLKTTINH